MNCTKGNKNSVPFAIIVILETDLPLLIVKIPEILITSKVNLNDDIQIDITYYKSPDDAFYSLIYLYMFEIVATKRFDYISFRFKIWDIFSNFE
jgi:hypothetical protein